jgi:nucleotide-binding universal stress UspA family protein
MLTVEASKRIALKNILFLTDFSEPSAAALPFASMVARSYGAKVTALHVLVPTAYQTKEKVATVADDQEDLAIAEMERVEAELVGIPRETLIERGAGVWAALSPILKEREFDLIVLGTHGWTGSKKALLGSSAEEVFRRAAVPVLTIGPHARNRVHSGGRFHCILFATDFNAVSSSASAYAVSLAQENQARFVLLHVLPAPQSEKQLNPEAISVAEALHRLGDLVPPEADLWCRAVPIAEHGNARDEILAVANRCNADLIVLGVRGMDQLKRATTLVKNPIAYDVVVDSPCPVLTVRA